LHFIVRKSADYFYISAMVVCCTATAIHSCMLLCAVILFSNLLQKNIQWACCHSVSKC